MHALFLFTNMAEEAVGSSPSKHRIIPARTHAAKVESADKRHKAMDAELVDEDQWIGLMPVQKLLDVFLPSPTEEADRYKGQVNVFKDLGVNENSEEELLASFVSSCISIYLAI